MELECDNSSDNVTDENRLGKRVQITLQVALLKYSRSRPMYVG